MSWIDFIANLFAGSGTTLLDRFLSRKKTSQQQQSGKPAQETIIPPDSPKQKIEMPKQRQIGEPIYITPQDIKEAIDSSPPYMQDDVCNNFAGNWLSASGFLLFLHKHDSDVVQVGVRKELTDPIVYFNVNISDYSAFKIIKEGTPLCVIGRIYKIKYLTNVYIEDISIEFPKS